MGINDLNCIPSFDSSLNEPNYIGTCKKCKNDSNYNDISIYDNQDYLECVKCGAVLCAKHSKDLAGDYCHACEIDYQDEEAI